MRILQISSAEQLGGGERHFVDLCSSLAKAGHEVVAVVRPQSPLPKLLHSIAATRKLPLRGAADLPTVYRLAKLIEETSAEVVHAHYARDYPVAALAVRLSRLNNSRRNSKGALPAFFLTRHHYLPVKANRV